MDIYKTNYRRYWMQATDFQSHSHTMQTHISPAKPVGVKYNSNKYLNPSIGAPIALSDSIRIYNDYNGCFALENDATGAVRMINKSKLSSIVRKSLNRSNFQILGWRTRKLDGGAGNPVSLGLYRFEGVGVDKNESLDWSVILKLIQSPGNLGYENFGEGEDQTHWNYWKRELLIYQSSWLDSLPEGLAAPRCFEAVEMPGNIGGMWLEDVQDAFAGEWPLHRYALTARHLGRLNGIYLSHRQLPDYPWLSRNRTRQWLSTIPWKAFPWDHPKVRQDFPDERPNTFRNMLEEYDYFLSKLEHVPKTISHGDTYPTNFASRHPYRNQFQTVALDWALAGIEPLGDDLGQLVYGTCMNLKSYKLQDISETLFTAYINGLQDSGCRLDPQLVRFSYAACAAFRVGLFRMVVLEEELKKEDNLMPKINTPRFGYEPFESVMAEEAYRLADIIN